MLFTKVQFILNNFRYAVRGRILNAALDVFGVEDMMQPKQSICKKLLSATCGGNSSLQRPGRWIYIYKYLLSKQSVRSPSHPGNRVYGFSPHPSILLTPNLMHCAADYQWGRGGPKLPEDF